MSFDFGILEKLREVYEAVRRNVWYLVPIVGFFQFCDWLLFTYLPARAADVINRVQSMLPAANFDLSTVGIDWDRINQWAPLNEMVAYSAAYISLALLLVMLRFVKKLLPFS